MHTIRQGIIGGGETYLYNLVTNMNKNIYDPIVLSFTDGEMVDKLRKNGITTYVIKTKKPFSVHLYKKISDLMKKEMVDLVHIHGTRAATNSLIPAKLTGIPSIYTVHGWSFHTGNNYFVTKLRTISEGWLSKNCESTVCGSIADVEVGQKLNGIGDFNLIYNSIDTEIFDPENVESNFRNDNGFSKDDFLVAFIARITFQKDPQTFIKAVAQVVKSFPLIKFLMIGDGELKSECMELADKLGVRKNLTFLPFSKNVEQVLKAVDVFVLPSLWEVIPLALLEAMSMKKICIASNIPGTKEALVDNENGYLFNPGDFKALSELIINSSQRKNKNALLGENARKTVVEKFDLKNLVKKNEELYLRIMKGRNSEK